LQVAIPEPKAHTDFVQPIQQEHVVLRRNRLLSAKGFHDGFGVVFKGRKSIVASSARGKDERVKGEFKNLTI
jgi:hypothetical protein